MSLERQPEIMKSLGALVSLRGLPCQVVQPKQARRGTLWVAALPGFSEGMAKRRI